MKAIFILFVFIFFSYVEVNRGVIKFEVSGKSGVIFHEPFPLNLKGIPRWNPSLEEVLFVDSMVTFIHVCELGGCGPEAKIFNGPSIIHNKSEYFIQAYGRKSNHDEILVIYYLWKKDLEETQEINKNLITVYGDTSHYWEIFYNKTKKSYYVIVGGLTIISENIH